MATTQKSGVEARRSPAKPATSPAPAPRVLEDQKVTAQAVSGDQKTVPAKAKKSSQTVVGWKANISAKLYADGKGVITLTAKGRGDKPKRNKGTSPFGALDRFRLYKDGMTVAEYQAECKKHNVSLAQAMSDVRWDVAQGLITVA
jgi:hypothetical protein